MVRKFGPKLKDDFKWDTYTKEHYEPQINSIIKNTSGKFGSGKDFIINNFSIKNNELVFEEQLHFNWMELYNQVYKLNVKSVYECGCGCTHHLININIIRPNIEIAGCDYSQSQIDLGYKYFNLEKYNFNNNIIVKDLTVENTVDEMKKYEFVYTHAVIMHLTDERAKYFLINMGKLSSRYIFLIENFMGSVKCNTPRRDPMSIISVLLSEFNIVFNLPPKYNENTMVKMQCILLERKPSN